MKLFNVRVYGLLLDEGRVLVSDELIKGHKITKFPGGGLEFGEGTIECVIREFKEELNLNIEVVDHFYTTDFFVASAFNPNSQVISIYYHVRALEPINAKISEEAFDFDPLKEEDQAFRWLKVDELHQNNFTFAIDKKVSSLLNKKLH
ncbi:MAG: NUDIX domain-containing protein [Bacteroidetes bacterium]|nr:NUDIX domain-containing protein [Bacteroidota bacterium]